VTDTLTFWIALAGAPGVGPASFRALCGRFGDPAGVFNAGQAELRELPDLRDDTLAALLDPEPLLRSAQETLGRLHDNRITVVTHDDPAYSRSLLDLPDPPPVVYVRGALPGPDDRTFSISGSATPSDKAVRIARAVGRDLARAGWTVVSGYALGVDTAAHVGALEETGRTVMALPMGVLAFEFRPEFERFAERLGREIVLVSECAPDEPWSRRAAVRRDRIIAALGQGLLAVEARPDGGTMITFKDALKLGRPAYVVKYRVPPPGASGNEIAIRLGGLPVDSLGAFRRIIEAPELPRAVPATEQGELF